MIICISLRFFTNMITNFACILNILPDYKVKNSAGRVWTVMKCQELSSCMHPTAAADTTLIKKKGPENRCALSWSSC